MAESEDSIFEVESGYPLGRSYVKRRVGMLCLKRRKWCLKARKGSAGISVGRFYRREGKIWYHPILSVRRNIALNDPSP